ncbi:DUF4190 domain-containing protein [Demequina sp. NBRC 110056]|uniref:DUF4190 domain-containing protein n=1 Tax=Demequina sp. NBRC 110056 TaxID=1570345 RepID=UPI000A003727|nr:DUF4190 domain-containing protein [Demequina sp. NBRC 110056]
MSDITPPPPPPPPAAGQPFPGGGSSEEKNQLGVWALVLGILSIVCCGLLAGIPAIILGKKSKEAGEQGLATNGNIGNVGFILGIIGSILSVLGGILYAVLIATGTYEWSTTGV